MKQFEILHGDFKISSGLLSCLFPLIDMNRHLLNNFLLVFFTDKPMIQMISLTSTSSFILLFTLIFRPFKTIKIFLTNIINEIIVCFIYISVLYLSYLDRNKDFDLTKRLKIGRGILYANMGLNFFFSLLFFLDLAFALISLIVRLLKKLIRKN